MLLNLNNILDYLLAKCTFPEESILGSLDLKPDYSNLDKLRVTELSTETSRNSVLEVSIEDISMRLIFKQHKFPTERESQFIINEARFYQYFHNNPHGNSVKLPHSFYDVENFLLAIPRAGVHFSTVIPKVIDLAKWEDFLAKLALYLFEFHKYFEMGHLNVKQYIQLNGCSEMVYTELLNKLKLANANETILINSYVKENFRDERIGFYKFLVSDQVRSKLLEIGSTLIEADCLIHGDLHIDNVRYEKAAPYFIDFEYTGVGDRLYDVTTFLFTFLYNEHLLADHSKEFRFALFSIFLTNYMGHFKASINSDAIKKIAFFCITHLIHEAGKGDNKTYLKATRDLEILMSICMMESPTLNDFEPIFSSDDV